MTLSNSLLQALDSTHAGRAWQVALSIIACTIGSCVTTELLGYWLHRLLHSGLIGFLSRNHMKHHLVLYGPLQNQRSTQYQDATDERLSLGNIGLEWLIPAALLLVTTVAVFYFFHVPLVYQFVCLGTSLVWGFLMFSYLHDVMHVEGFWMERNRWFRRWFTSPRELHDIHHRVINDQGFMNKNFGIGFFLFDRLFGTLSGREQSINQVGYQAAIRRFNAIVRELS
jgi:sterol desaturase/sphingolipid hydroxylase (fatty acid hydroxylase superfamily)